MNEVREKPPGEPGRQERVVVQSTAGAKQRQQPRGASGQHRLTNVLRHADARNRVIGPVVNVTVVLDADRHTQSLGTYAAPSIVAQFSGDSDTDRLNSVVASSVADEGPQPHPTSRAPIPGLSPSLCATRSHLACWACSRPKAGPCSCS